MRQEVTIAGEDAWICATTGWVKGEKKWSETHVSGGGARVVGNTVYSAPVTTSNATRHEFWICSVDGTETCVDLGNSNVRVRDGQLVSAAWGASKRSDNGPFVMVHNHSGQESKWLIGNDEALIKRMKLKNPLGEGKKFLLIALAATGALVFFASSHLLGLLLLVGGIGGLFYSRQQRTEKAAQIRASAQKALTEEIQATSHLYLRPTPPVPQPFVEPVLPPVQLPN
jgi:hypothetical protein